MNEEVTLLDYARYLERVRDLYPGGIPKSILAAPVGREPFVGQKEVCFSLRGAGHAQLAFAVIAGSDDDALSVDERALFEAAVTKGMKLKLNAVIEISLRRSAPGAEFSFFEQLAEALKAHAVQILVCLGSDAAALLLNRTCAEIRRGAWHEFSGVDVISTHRLGAVLTGTAYKREFWEDLQAVLVRLKEKNHD
jgi:hypothetical protein